MITECADIIDTFTSGEAFSSTGRGGSSASRGLSAVQEHILAAPDADAPVLVRPALLATLWADDTLQHLPGANLIARTFIAPLYSGIAAVYSLGRHVWLSRHSVSASAYSSMA